jgi:hypothetical protein
VGKTFLRVRKLENVSGRGSVEEQKESLQAWKKLGHREVKPPG